MRKRKLFAEAVTIAAVAGAITPTIALTSCNNEEEIIDVPDVTEAGTVVILATGGTIAGAGEEGKETGYKPGSISVESLIASVPGIEDIAPLRAQQVCNINSDDITSKIWIKLAKTINKYAKQDNVAGFVIMHGTDTMEETAYFLNLAVNTDKPVVITGSMRPATSISADGPMNLYQSVVVAASEDAKSKGVMGVFSDQIFSARSMQKESTFNVTAISAGPMGALGFVRNKEVYFYEQSIKKHTTTSGFSSKVESWSELPEIPVVYFNADTDPRIIEWFHEHHPAGLVVAGAGAGEFSEKFIAKLNAFVSDDYPVIISSRIDSGVITQDSVLVKKAVAANDLPPHKAAILLRCAVQEGIKEQSKLIELFKQY